MKKIDNQKCPIDLRFYIKNPISLETYGIELKTANLFCEDVQILFEDIGELEDIIIKLEDLRRLWYEKTGVKQYRDLQL